MLLTKNKENKTPWAIACDGENRNGTLNSLFVLKSIELIVSRQSSINRTDLKFLFMNKICSIGNILHVLCSITNNGEFVECMNLLLLSNEKQNNKNNIDIKPDISNMNNNNNNNNITQALKIANRASFTPNARPIDFLRKQCDMHFGTNNNNNNNNNGHKQMWLNILSTL